VRGAGEAWGGGGAGRGAASSTGVDAGPDAAGTVVVVGFGAVVAVVVEVDGFVVVVVGRVVVVVEVDVVVVVGGATVCTQRKSAPQADPAKHSTMGRIRRRMGSEATIPALRPQLVELRPAGWARHELVMSSDRTYRGDPAASELIPHP
jgi:hypothetical protein